MDWQVIKSLNPDCKKSNVQRPIIEQIAELKAKLALLEGDRKAYYESSFQTLQQCKKRVIELRDQNKELRRELQERLSNDDQIIIQAFQNLPAERVALNGKTGQQALVRMDSIVCDSMKKLNALRHITDCKRRRLQDLETETANLNRVVNDIEAFKLGASLDGQKMRDLENQLDKSLLKCNEAEHIKKTYIKIKHKLEEERMTFERTLDAMEAEVMRCSNEMKELEAICKDATFSRDAALSELKRHEELVYGERKRRELELGALKKEAEEKRMATEKIEKKLNEDDMLDLYTNTQEENSGRTSKPDDCYDKTKYYEDIFRKLREVTGMSDLGEIIRRFENQETTRNELDRLKITAEARIDSLKTEKDEITKKLNSLKFSKEDNLNEQEEETTELSAQLDQNEETINLLDEEIASIYETLVQYASFIDQLLSKTASVIYQSKSIALNVTDEKGTEKILAAVSQLQERFTRILSRLESYDINREKTKKLKEQNEVLFIPSEYSMNLETKMNVLNTRVKLARQSKREDAYDEDDESGSDAEECLTRIALKKQSRQIIDQKKRKKGKKKKKKGAK